MTFAPKDLHLFLDDKYDHIISSILSYKRVSENIGRLNHICNETTKQSYSIKEKSNMDILNSQINICDNDRKFEFNCIVEQLKIITFLASK